jgi:undecaprenyl-phosphate 4-deoxy-4-formamido-L-arabinose transferase
MPVTTPPTVSIVIPVYNGQATIGALVRKLDELLASLHPLDIILVNDASSDGSLQSCLTVQKEVRTPVHVIDLSRNFGEHNAVMAGLHHVKTDYAVIMDDDFQNPPTEVRKLIEKAKEGYDVVYTRYPEKHHAFWRNLGSRFHNMVATWMLKKPRHLYLSSFKAMNKFTVEQMMRYSGPYPYLDGLILRSTRRIGVVDVQHAPRATGRSHYTATKLLRLWLNMFTNFSILPLRIATVLGLLFSFLGLLFGAVIVMEWFRNPDLPIGWASLAFVTVMFAGVQLTLIGVVGEYVGRIFMFQNSAPQFIVRQDYPPPPRA